MFGIIVGTHGQFATGIVQSCEMIFGKREHLRAVTLVPGEGPEDVYAKYEKAIKELGNPDRLLILNDLLGGTPYNQAARLVSQNENYGIVAGVNLPMLIAMSAAQDADDGSQTIIQLMEAAVTAGSEGINYSSYQTLNTEADEDDL